jgi:hypothetical protein
MTDPVLLFYILPAAWVFGGYTGLMLRVDDFSVREFAIDTLAPGWNLYVAVRSIVWTILNIWR